MECQEVQVTLGVYALGAAVPADRSSVEQHLRRCTPCREELMDLAALAAVLAGLSEAQARALEPESAGGCFATRRTKSRHGRRRSPPVSSQRRAFTGRACQP